MESSNPNNEEDDRFFDAPEDFPFYDCVSTHHQSDLSTSLPAEFPSPATNLLRRRSVSGSRISGKGSTDSDGVWSSIDSAASQINEPNWNSVVERHELYRDSKANEKGVESTELGAFQVDSLRDKGKDLDTIESGRAPVDLFQAGSSTSGEKNEESTVTTASDGRVGESVDSVPRLEEPSPTDWSLLVSLAGLVIKAIGFQLNLLISLITFPPWFFYCCCVFALDPFGTMRRSRDYLTSKIINLWNMICGSLSPFISEWLKDHKSMLKIALRFGWGLFWAIYVGTILLALFVSSLVFSGFMMRYLVEEPIVVKESLNFDYTKNSPEALVPLISCAGVDCDENCKDYTDVGQILGSRAIPPNHKLQVTVSLTLPESEYNRNLGMFQVRVDFLSAHGQTLFSSRHPCMLKFRSEPIRLIQTLLKIAPLVTGYVSEIQTLNLKFRGFIEREVPTACLKVMIEQRAEFRPGAGVPEIYDASLVLESELPFHKRIIWYWKKTLFVWISMSLFIMELLLASVCCRPLIIPRTRQRNRRSSRDASNLNGRAVHR